MEEIGSETLESGMWLPAPLGDTLLVAGVRQVCLDFPEPWQNMEKAKGGCREEVAGRSTGSCCHVSRERRLEAGLAALPNPEGKEGEWVREEVPHEAQEMSISQTPPRKGGLESPVVSHPESSRHRAGQGGRVWARPRDSARVTGLP